MRPSSQSANYTARSPKSRADEPQVEPCRRPTLPHPTAQLSPPASISDAVQPLRVILLPTSSAPSGATEGGSSCKHLPFYAVALPHVRSRTLTFLPIPGQQLGEPMGWITSRAG